MKYFSEKLNKVFDTEQELVAKESEYEASVREQKRLREEKEKAISKDKKELSQKIEDADKALEAAYEQYKVAKEECKNIVEEQRAEISEITDKAEKLVSDAYKAKVNALSEFTKKYGAYTKKLSGEDASKAFDSENLFCRLFPWLW